MNKVVQSAHSLKALLQPSRTLKFKSLIFSPNYFYWGRGAKIEARQPWGLGEWSVVVNRR